MRSRVAHDPALGMTVWKVNGPLVLAKTHVTGIYPATRGRAPASTWSREHCRGGSLTVSLSGDAQLLPDGNTVSTPAGASVRVVRQQGGHAPRPAHARAATRARSSSTSRRPPCRAR